MSSHSGDNDIICAVATPPGKSALAIVRVSGPASIALVARTIPALQDVTPDNARRLVYDFARDFNGGLIDEVTAIPYFAPKSYTAEEMVEIICHGGVAATRAMIEQLIGCGARIAEPGEFTKRAFLNGRISLSQAESVAAAIEAKSELALRAAALNLKGELYDRISKVRAEIKDLLTLIEAEIDFSEDEIEKTPTGDIARRIDKQLEEANRILKSYDFGRGLNAGYRIPIVGKANVGKSSLLNALLRRQRAIVTEIPGTTRDTLTEWIEIDGFPILLTDTAGLRESADHAIDVVEAIGQERTRREIKQADLILFMIDGSVKTDDEDERIYRQINHRPNLILVNKVDLGVSSEIEAQLQAWRRLPVKDVLFMSALKGTGLDDLKNAIARSLSLDNFRLESALLATERQYQAMKKACDSLAETLRELESNPSGEVIAVFLRETLDFLGELVGETTTEDILNDIFGRFCVGK